MAMHDAACTLQVVEEVVVAVRAANWLLMGLRVREYHTRTSMNIRLPLNSMTPIVAISHLQNRSHPHRMTQKYGQHSKLQTGALEFFSLATLKCEEFWIDGMVHALPRTPPAPVFTTKSSRLLVHVLIV